MRLWCAFGTCVIFVLTLLAVTLGPALGGVSETFAGKLADLIFPTLTGAAGTIVGTLFNDRESDSAS